MACSIGTLVSPFMAWRLDSETGAIILDMARIVTEQPLAQRPHHYGSFAERYPDFGSWLDGNTWELELGVDITEPLESFRASLRYQAQVFKLNLVTKTVYREDEPGVKRRYLLVRTY